VQVLNSSGMVLVEFFASWCRHYKQLAPTQKKVGTDGVLKGVTTVATLDADAHQVLAQVSVHPRSTSCFLVNRPRACELMGMFNGVILASLR
jgi:fluoride ion exporter CrcB/FEX